jgi:hypothetical protein
MIIYPVFKLVFGALIGGFLISVNDISDECEYRGFANMAVFDWLRSLSNNSVDSRPQEWYFCTSIHNFSRDRMKTLATILSAVLMVASPVFTGAQQTPSPKPAPPSPGAPAAVEAAGSSISYMPYVLGGLVVVGAAVVAHNNNNSSTPIVTTTGTTGS